MKSPAIPQLPISLELAGANDVRIWGMSNAERLRRLAHANGVETAGAPGNSVLWVSLGFVFDPAWFRQIIANPGMILIVGGQPVIAHLPPGVAIDAALQGDGFTVIDYDTQPIIYNRKLRKRESPFVAPLTTTTVRKIERDSYYGAYKGVTDILTKYLWPEIAFWMTRIAARLGMTPNMVTAIGATLCVAATFLFAYGHYWTGLACGFIFMVLDTVDGKLARCTITSSWWGNIFDHGIDLIHPPFWWFAWGLGTAYTAHPLSDQALMWVMVAVLAGYVVQRLIEGAFIRIFGFHIHVWRKVDSDFRLITARRNPNMVLLFVALLAGRPDIGLVAVAWWTVLSLVVHAIQLGQAYVARARRGPLTSWLEETA